MSVFAIGIEFSAHTCAACGCVFAITGEMERQRRQTGKEFHCPNGHPLVFDSENARLKKQVAQLTQRIDQKDAAIRDEQARHLKTEHRLRGTKAALTRTKNAVAAGKCPCCAAEFADLAAHMQDTHPDYHQADDQEEAAS